MNELLLLKVGRRGSGCCGKKNLDVSFAVLEVTYPTGNKSFQVELKAGFSRSLLKLRKQHKWVDSVTNRGLEKQEKFMQALNKYLVKGMKILS